nr:distal tail protein Dit [Thermoactinomyces sp. DSM 45891]
MRGFKFAGKHSSEFHILVTNISRSILPPLTEKTVNVPSRAGGYFFGTEIGMREFQVDITISGKTDTEMMEKFREIGVWLRSDEEQELIFDVEPTKTYFAYLTGSTDLQTVGTTGFSTLRFLCPDPYSYGPLIESPVITSSPVEVKVEGKEKTYPVIVANFKENSTYFSLATKDQYIHIGNPEGLDQITIPPEEKLIDDEMLSTSGWTSFTNIDEGSVGGVITPDDWSFVASDYGKGSEWHGPALQKMSTTSAKHFRLEAIVGFYSVSQMEMGRIEFYLLDTNGGVVGKLALMDAWVGSESTKIEARAGTRDDGHYFANTVGSMSYKKKTTYVKKKVRGRTKTVAQTQTEEYGQYSDFYGKITIERIGPVWRAQLIRLSKFFGLEVASSRVEFRWVNPDIDDYNEPVSGVAIHFGQHSSYQVVPSMYCSQLTLKKINPITTIAVPEIIEAGDEVVIDCEVGSIYKNGTVWLSELNMGSQYLSLEGDVVNNLAYQPADKCELKIYHRGRYL